MSVDGEDANRSVGVGWDAPVDDVPVCELCEEEQAAVFCGDCDNVHALCRTCDVKKHKVVDRTTHTRREWTEKDREYMCASHRKKFILYSVKDKKMACEVCLSLHKGPEHVSVSIQVQAQKVMKRINAKLNILGGCVNDNEQVYQQSAQVWKQLTGNEFDEQQEYKQVVYNESGKPHIKYIYQALARASICLYLYLCM